MGRQSKFDRTYGGMNMNGIVFIEIVGGCEGDSISISNAEGSGKRICGPKPWGGGNVKQRWKVSIKDIESALREAKC